MAQRRYSVAVRVPTLDLWKLTSSATKRTAVRDAPLASGYGVRYAETMRRMIAVGLTLLAVACTSMSTPPPPAKLPSFALSSLQGTPVQVIVLDQRPGERDPRWTERVEADVREMLTASGVRIAAESPTRFEVRVLRGRSDFEDKQWRGCVEITGRVTGMARADASGDACVAKSNLWGKMTADNVLRLAYQDAMVKMLSTLDSELTP